MHKGDSKIYIPRSNKSHFYLFPHLIKVPMYGFLS